METLTVCPTSTATILACQKIARAFKENIYELSSVRTEWDPAYATSLNIWIEDTMDKYFVDNLDEFDDKKYREWHEIMVAGLQSLKILRASLKVDFKDDKPFLKKFFEKTGYNEYFSDAKNGDHISMCKFLTAFAKNIDNATRKKIVAKGTPDSLFDKILTSAKNITQYEECFEALQSDAHLNNYGQKEIKEIYSTIQDISRIATAYYDFDPVKRSSFSFYKTLVNL